jgi:predicted secreted protein
MAVRKLARGTQLQRKDGANWVKIAQAIGVDGPSQTAEVFVFDDHDVAAGYKEKLKKSKDGGQVTLNVHFDIDDATHGQVYDDFEDMGVPKEYRLVHPTATKCLQFHALVVGIAPAAPVDGAITANITLDISGAVSRPNVAP